MYLIIKDSKKFLYKWKSKKSSSAILAKDMTAKTTNKETGFFFFLKLWRCSQKINKNVVSFLFCFQIFELKQQNNFMNEYISLFLLIICKSIPELS